jgi:hypothetical protein
MVKIATGKDDSGLGPHAAELFLALGQYRPDHGTGFDTFGLTCCNGNHGTIP